MQKLMAYEVTLILQLLGVLSLVLLAFLAWLGVSIVKLERQLSRVGEWMDNHQDTCDERHKNDAEARREIWREIERIRDRRRDAK